MSSTRRLTSVPAGTKPALLVLTGLVLMGLVLMGIAMMANVASAQPINGYARWCATFPDNGVYDCAYHTREQCMAAASGVTNHCSLNSWYQGPPPRRSKRDPRR
jgi:hypothetical protein